MRNILLFTILLLVFLSCRKTADPENPLVARVGKSTLTKAAVDRMSVAVSNNAYSETDIVSSWADRELLFLAAQDAGIENDETLKAQIDVFRKDLFGRTFLDNSIASDITVDNSEIRSYYDKNRAIFKHKNDGAKIMHFVVPVDTVAEFIARTLRNPNETVDRKTLLSNYMVDVVTIEKGSLIYELDEAVFSSTRSNFVLGPVKSDYGYHVIEVLNRYSSGSKIDIDEAYDEIYQIIFNQKKQMRSVRFLDSLRNRYNVKIYLENN